MQFLGNHKIVTKVYVALARQKLLVVVAVNFVTNDVGRPRRSAVGPRTGRPRRHHLILFRRRNCHVENDVVMNVIGVCR